MCPPPSPPKKRGTQVIWSSVIEDLDQSLRVLIAAQTFFFLSLFDTQLVKMHINPLPFSPFFVITTFLDMYFLNVINDY